MPPFNDNGKIASGKISFDTLFNSFWFRIPNYQRPYVWTAEQITTLLDDIKYSADFEPEKEFFLGSIVLKKVTDTGELGQSYDVLDGQQRIVTLLFLLAVIREKTDSSDLQDDCTNYILQKASKYKRLQERMRINFQNRDEVDDFIKDFTKERGKIIVNKLKQIGKDKYSSISNMAKALLHIQDFFKGFSKIELQDYATYLFNKVILLYVASDNLIDAFRLFSILNGRGLPLSSLDIIKSWNLESVNDANQKAKYAKFWIQKEEELGLEQFEKIVTYFRTILLKEKFRDNLLSDFKEKIYKQPHPLLQKGEPTFLEIKSYIEVYHTAYLLDKNSSFLDNEYKNLLIVMKKGLKFQEWIPPLLLWCKKFGYEKALFFLRKLDSKFSIDWIVGVTALQRVKYMNELLQAIDYVERPDEILEDESLFKIDCDKLKSRLDQRLFGKAYDRYVLLKLEFLAKDHSAVFQSFKLCSIEHILPQNPKPHSDWYKKFTKDEHQKWLHKLGNLVLLSGRKNTQLSNRSFLDKKNLYFSGKIDGFPQSLQVMQYYEWTPGKLAERHYLLLETLIKHYQASIQSYSRV